VCEDDVWKDCERRAERGECEDQDLSIVMLGECRRSCREKYSDKTLPDIIQTYGGLEDHVVDVFGFKMPICAENGAVETYSRFMHLQLIAIPKEQPAWVPKLTTDGFKKTRIPPDVFAMLQWDYQRKKSFLYEEILPYGAMNKEWIVNNKKKAQSSIKNVKNSFLIDLCDYVRYQLEEKLHPLAEEWSNIKLQNTFTYGMRLRRYINGSVLLTHVDNLHNHAVGAILNIGQSVEVEWPLYLEDNKGGQHMVVMKPGDMVWYESGRIIHGRPAPLQGEFYDNIIVDFRPVGEWYTTDYQIGKKPRSSPITLLDIRNTEDK